MVHVYIADVANLPDPLECLEIMKGLPETRIEKIKKQKQLKDRKQSFGAGILLLKVLKKHKISMGNLFYVENGKPDLEEVCFNLSHSNDTVVCAISEMNIGVDIEKIEEIKTNIAKRFFTEHENRYLNQFNEEDKKEEFFRLWTMKESYMKYTGEGMKLSLDRFEFHFDDEVSVYREGEKLECHIKEYDVPGYRLTVCAEEKDFDMSLHEINLLEDFI